MSSKKNTHLKQMKNRVRSKTVPVVKQETPEDIIDPQLLKNKKIIELDTVEDAVPVLEEKSDEETPATEDTDDSNTDEISLDDDELNPFGDKWEQ
ncbi:MAG: hypothetical protein WC666_03540 [Candidatus Paceibacterota bacterium]|jgi:hypothetical protein